MNGMSVEMHFFNLTVLLKEVCCIFLICVTASYSTLFKCAKCLLHSLQNIVPPNVRRLHLSDCGAQTIMNLAKRVQMIGSNVDHFYIALDFRTFKNATEALNVLKVCDLG